MELLLPALAVLLLTAAFSEAASRPRYGGTLRVSFAQAANSVEPWQAETLPERTVAAAVYESLVEMDGRGAAAPAIAASWAAESGGRRWVFQLRPGPRWHNGSAVTAASVRAALERAVAAPDSLVGAALRNAQFACTAPAAARLVCETADALPLPAILAHPALALADADGGGTGPFKLAAFTRGARARLEAFESHSRGRPFLDAVELEFGVDPRRQRVEFELRRADVLVPGPSDPRPAGSVRASEPANLLLAGFAETDRGSAARRLLLSVFEPQGLARLLPAGVGEPAVSFLPAWLSGYQFLLSPPEKPSRAVNPGPFTLAYDDGDAVARLIASRLALDARAARAELRVEALPRTVFEQARRTGSRDIWIDSVRLRGEQPAWALFDALPGATGLPPADWYSVEAQFRLERAALENAGAIPLLHYRDRYSFQGGLETVRLTAAGVLDLAGSWRKP